MLKQRVITAVILIGALIAALWFLNPFQLSLIVAALVLLGSWEWAKLSGLKSHLSRIPYLVLVALLLLGAAWLMGLPDRVSGGFLRQASQSALLWWLVAIVLIISYPQSAKFWEPTAVKLLFGILVLVPPFIAAAYVLYLNNGVLWMLLSITIVALADIGAYFSGKTFGKHKLAPAVSPGKTWEGLLGGLAVNFVLVVVLILLNDFTMTPGWVFLLVMLPAVLSVFGDLLESMVKRQCGIKDSGSILPGHGGIMDRIDGLTAAIPAFALILHYSGAAA